jgi:hypothetical protein
MMRDFVMWINDAKSQKNIVQDCKNDDGKEGEEEEGDLKLKLSLF